MNSLLKFSLLFVVVSVVLVGFGNFTNILSLFGAGFSFATTGLVGEVLTAILGFISFFFDTLFFADTTLVYTTHYGGIVLGSFSWLFTVVRAIFGLAIVTFLVKLIID